MLEVSEREEGVVAFHLPIGPLKPAVGWSRYRDVNPIPISSLADDLATISSLVLLAIGPIVFRFHFSQCGFVYVCGQFGTIPFLL